MWRLSHVLAWPPSRKAVTEHGPRSGSALDRLAIGTITALAAIAAAGLVHRDFKPDNVLLASDGPRVVDFGIARALDLSDAVTGHPIGTPAYMAPEQFHGGELTSSADVFAWACTMVFAATGRPPHGADSIPRIMYRKLQEDADLGVFPTQASEPLHTLVVQGLATEPAARPSADRILQRLLGHPAA